MKRNFLVLSLFLMVAGATAYGQQDKLITHFMYDKMSLNPGATAADGGVGTICGTLMYRNQWDRVNGAPNSAVLNLEADLTRYFPGRVGIAFYHDAIAFTRQNNLLINYSFPLELGGAGTLGIGVGIGLMNIGMNPQWAPPTTDFDPTLPGGFSSMSLDLNFGLYWRGSQGYYVGISSTHLSESRMLGMNQSETGLVSYNSARHYYLMGGYKYDLSNDNGAIEGNVMVRTDFVKFSADINARYHLGMIPAYAGITYRTSDAIAIMLGYEPIPHLTVGYSYDITINKLASYSRGSHEIMVKYCYTLPVPPLATSKHPRWL
ncbi:MAG: PorP/SprF family type IX secretion system membrane protein [Crocinitomicaceae bacterium]|nr:PorP/SprF family type IX secretion system membrane protein [Crocinitomicaceae bacterium]